MQATQCETTPLSAVEHERLRVVVARMDGRFDQALAYMSAIPPRHRAAELELLESAADAMESDGPTMCALEAVRLSKQVGTLLLEETMSWHVAQAEISKDEAR